MGEFKLSAPTVKAVMQSSAVRSALRSKADSVAPEAATELNADQGADVSEGTRPAGRPFARVSVDKRPSMDIVKARQTLARVAGRHSAPK